MIIFRIVWSEWKRAKEREKERLCERVCNCDRGQNMRKVCCSKNSKSSWRLKRLSNNKNKEELLIYANICWVFAQK